MDALLLYTIRLALHHPTPNQDDTTVYEKKATVMPNSVFHSIKTWPLRPGDKVPKLQRDNLLSLLYHADEQWIDSIRQINHTTNKEQDHQQYLVDIVHRQQMIYLDTLILLHKAINHSSKATQNQSPRQRLQESILFAAQILHDNKNSNDLRHLEHYTEELKPFADRVCLSLDMLRKVARQQALLSTRASALATTHLLQTRLDDFLRQWDQFESLLYQCYGRVVFGLDKSDTISTLTDLLSSSATHTTTFENIKVYRSLPQELFSDSFTRILPVALHRALSFGRIHPSAIQDLDPIAFIAVPRLAVLSGMVHLHTLSGWRQQSSENSNVDTSSCSYSVWFQSQADAMCKLKQHIEDLEQEIIRQADYRASVQYWTVLEDALVHGWDEHNEKILGLPTSYRTIYICICHIADTLLADENARPFVVILRHLFAHFADDSLASSSSLSTPRRSYQNNKEESYSGIDENIILDLAI